MGRPSTYTDKVADAICERIANGETLRAICRDDGFPHWNTVYDWMAANEAFAGRFARAREVGFDAIAQDTLQIIDSEPAKVATAHGEHVDSGHVAWVKGRVDQRMKLLAKWDPKRYGERTTLAGDPDAPLQIAEIRRTVVEPK